MKKIATIVLMLIMLVGCGGVSTKPQPINSTVLNDLSRDTALSIPDDDITELDFTNSSILKQSKPIPQRFAPDTLDIEKNSFWSDCVPRGYDTFENFTKSMICYPYIITRYSGSYIHGEPEFFPCSYSCYNIDTGKLIWTKEHIQDVTFDPLTKMTIARNGSGTKTTLIDTATGNDITSFEGNYLESDGKNYFLAEQNYPDDSSGKNNKIIIIGDLKTGKILNDKFISIQTDQHDKASFFDLYRFFNGKPVLKDSLGNELNWDWNSKEYLCIDRYEKIVGNLLLLPYRTSTDIGSYFTINNLDCYDIDTGEKKWSFSEESQEGTMIKDPELYIVGNKILMEFADLGTPYTCSYVFDLNGKRYQLPSGFKINERSKIKNIGNVLTGYNDKTRDNLGFDINELKTIDMQPYDFVLGGKLYQSKTDFSQSDPQTMKKEWFSKEKFENEHSYLDSMATDDWVIVLSIKDTYNEDVKNKLQLCVYDRNSGKIVKEISIDYGWTWSTWSDARLGIYNKKIIIQTQIGVYVLGDKKNTKIKVSGNILRDDQPEPISRVDIGKYGTPNYPDPIPKVLNITNVSDQNLNFKIIVPYDSNKISIVGQSEFELKPGENKDILHEINKFEGRFCTNHICPILIQYGDNIESIVIVTAIRNYPD